MRAKNEWGLGRGASPRPKPPLAFPTRLFSFSRLSGSLGQAKSNANALSQRKAREKSIIGFGFVSY